MSKCNAMARTPKIEMIVPKPLISTAMCCSQSGRTGVSKAAFYHQRRTVNFPKWGKHMKTATDILKGYSDLKNYWFL